MTFLYDSGGIARRIKSACAAFAVVALLFALMPISRSAEISRQSAKREYISVDILPKKRAPGGGSGGQGANGKSVLPNSSGANSAEVSAPMPNIPAAYGLVRVGAGDAGNFDFGGLGAGSGAGEGLEISDAEFGMQAFSFDALDTVPRRLKSGRSVYPRHLYNRGLEGEVRLSLFINTDGSVELDSVLSSTNADFEKAAIAAALNQQYEAPMRGGIPVRARFELLIPFKILK